MTRDPYNFEFLGLAGKVAERALEDALVERLEAFLLELGHGFATWGRQYHLEVGGDDFYIDLRFYHARLHRYIVVELKVDSF